MGWKVLKTVWFWRRVEAAVVLQCPTAPAVTQGGRGLFSTNVEPQLFTSLCEKAQVSPKIRCEISFDTCDCQAREERLSFHINSSWQAPDFSSFHRLQRCQELRQTKGKKYFIHPVNSEFRDTHYELSQVQSSGSSPGQECSLLRLVFFGSLKRRRMLSAFESSKRGGANARTI